MDDLVEVELYRVVIQEKGDQQFLHLRAIDGGRSFPIVIGFYEASEIHRKLKGLEPVRPLTHDLCGRILRSLDIDLPRVIISELRDSTFYAKLVLACPDGDRLVDCRPSDAIALAVQTQARLFVARSVFEAVSPE